MCEKTAVRQSAVLPLSNYSALVSVMFQQNPQTFPDS